MSTNIESVEIIYNDNFRISRNRWKDLHYSYLKGELETAECNFFENEKLHDFENKSTDDYCHLHEFDWSGGWSGNSFDYLLERILPFFEGEAHLVFIWEGGMGQDGVKVKDGKVTTHEVIMTLGSEVSWKDENE